MRVKKGTVLYQMHPSIDLILEDGNVLDNVFNEFANRDCIVTAGRNGKHRGRGHKKGSRHYHGEAVDLRTNDLERDVADTCCEEIQMRLLGYHVVLEAADTPNEHIHVEVRHGEVG
jgi:hypothetical protein